MVKLGERVRGLCGALLRARAAVSGRGQRSVARGFTRTLNTTSAPPPSRRRSTKCSESRHGVCQDFAHLMIACLRSLELPARYVSGYLRSGRTNSWAAEASHAWVSVWCPVFGWQGFDPTNNTMPQDGARHAGLGPRLLRRDAGQGRRAGRRRARDQRVGGRDGAGAGFGGVRIILL